MSKDVDFEKVFKLVTSRDWKNYDVEDFEVDGEQLSPEEIDAAHKMSMVIYDDTLGGQEVTAAELVKIKPIAIKFAENPYTYINDSSLAREARG